MTDSAAASVIGAIYDEYGEYYHQSRSNAAGRLANEFIDMPAVLSVLPVSVDGKRVLDAGCGSGIYSRLLAERGAHVNGVDVSSKMIEIARRETHPGLGVDYRVGDISNVPYPVRFFDVVLCTYVLENVPDLTPVFQEFGRVLSNRGILIFSISHPLRAMAVRERRGQEEVWALYDYFGQSKRQSDFGGGMIVPKYCRTVEEYAEAIASAGLAITGLLEPRPIPSGRDVDPKGYDTAMRLPQVLVVRAVRMG